MQHCNRQLFPVNKRSNYYSTIVYVFTRHPDNDYDSLRPLLTVAAWEWPAPRSLRRSFVERSCCACAAIPVGWTLVSCALKADVATAAARRGTCASPPAWEWAWPAKRWAQERVLEQVPELSTYCRYQAGSHRSRICPLS